MPLYKKFYEEDVAGLVELWRGVLGLDEWDVEVRLSKVSEMTNRKWRGEISYDADIQNAQIQVLRASSNRTDPDYDMEKTLVHELLHMRFADFDKVLEMAGEPGSVAYELLKTKLESSVDRLSILFVDLARQTESFYSVLGK
jgi:hypothetical protein